MVDDVDHRSYDGEDYTLLWKEFSLQESDKLSSVRCCEAYDFVPLAETSDTTIISRFLLRRTQTTS